MSELAVSIGSDLPDSWTVASLEDVAVLSPKSDTTHLDAGDLVHFVPMAAVAEDFGGIDVSKLRAVDEVRKGYTSFAENDVLFAKITPCMENGKGALVPPLPNKYAFGSTEFHVIRSSTAVLPKWIAHYLAQPDFRKVARRNMTGTAGQMRVPSSWLATIGVPVAPIAEQTRIVEKLEELLSDLDAGVAELKAAQRKLAQYRQSLLKAAVEGALTADWRAARESVRPEPVEGRPSSAHASTSSARTDEGETGAALLQRILTERRTRWETRQLAKFAEQGKTPSKDRKTKYPETVAPDTSNMRTLPQDWVWSSLGRCFHVAVGATPSRKEPAYWDGDIPWVSSGEVRFARIISTKEMITEDGLNNTSTQINPVGSVLLGMIGEGKTRGQVAILDIEAANNQNCAAIWVPETDVPPEYVYYWLWSRYEETRRGSSGNNQPALNKSIVEAFPFPVPPLDELREIVTRVENSLANSDRQETALTHALKQATAQRKNILKAAFAGQLVPQDPNDEPASVLLERIRAGRSTQEASGKKRGRTSRTSA